MLNKGILENGFGGSYLKLTIHFVKLDNTRTIIIPDYRMAKKRESGLDSRDHMSF